MSELPGEVKFIGITKSTDPTQKRAPWRIEYEKEGKRYARYETSHVKAIQLAEERFGKSPDVEEIKLSGKMIEIPLVEGKATAPLIAALIKEGVALVEVAEKAEPTNSSLIQFKEYLKQAQEATTPEARSDALIGMEGLEDEVRAIAKMLEVAKPKRYIIKEEPEPLYKSGTKYVAYFEDGTPRYMAAETEQALKTRLLEAEPDAEFVTSPGELLECMICHQKFDHLIIGTCESCYKKWTGGK